MSTEKEEQIKVLRQNIDLNKEILNNLKEFFGSYLSDFLKTYRNNEETDKELKEILARQDQIFSKFHDLMEK